MDTPTPSAVRLLAVIIGAGLLALGALIGLFAPFAFLGSLAFLAAGGMALVGIRWAWLVAAGGLLLVASPASLNMLWALLTERTSVSLAYGFTMLVAAPGTALLWWGRGSGLVRLGGSAPASGAAPQRPAPAPAAPQPPAPPSGGPHGQGGFGYGPAPHTPASPPSPYAPPRSDDGYAYDYGDPEPQRPAPTAPPQPPAGPVLEGEVHSPSNDPFAHSPFGSPASTAQPDHQQAPAPQPAPQHRPQGDQVLTDELRSLAAKAVPIAVAATPIVIGALFKGGRGAARGVGATARWASDAYRSTSDYIAESEEEARRSRREREDELIREEAVHRAKADRRRRTGNLF